MARVLHDDGCRSFSAGWGRECDCVSGRYEERQTVMGGAGVIVAIFRPSDGGVRYVVERVEDGRLGIFSAEELTT